MGSSAIYDKPDHDHIFKKYENESDLIDTLPIKAIGVLNQYLEKYALIDQSAVPSQFKSKYCFDANRAIIFGPFGKKDGTSLCVEQQQDDDIRFTIIWDPTDDTYICIYFYDSSESCLYYLEVTQDTIRHRDWPKDFNIRCYDINSDGLIEFSTQEDDQYKTANQKLKFCNLILLLNL